MSKSSFALALIAEFVGSVLLVLVSTCALQSMARGELSWTAVALANGFVTAGLLWAASACSGAHLNPVVTLAELFLRSLRPGHALAYIITQLTGSFSAAALIYFLNGETGAAKVPYPSLNADFATEFQAFLLEFILSGLFVAAYYSTSVDKRGPTNVFGFAQGAVILGGTLIAGPISGGAVNPLRHFGPSFMALTFDETGLQWVAQIIGGLSVAFYFEFFLMNDQVYISDNADEDSGNTLRNYENQNIASTLKN